MIELQEPPRFTGASPEDWQQTDNPKSCRQRLVSNAPHQPVGSQATVALVVTLRSVPASRQKFPAAFSRAGVWSVRACMVAASSAARLTEFKDIELGAHQLKVCSDSALQVAAND